ncbi:hypothetical protein OG393_30910 [Streptomyces sp. NBC_01216]|uniref:hypothetical protein n=1 Tax=Streptomyces sp. NBC_01216 TaxID=2903778 RepID=UPI002E122B0C|nr:hypothetical protein OG393_30910 [Streptomyces sp. NBC_01216]
MKPQLSRRITVAEYLVRQGLPADWRYASAYGRAAARVYRQTYRREPGKAFRMIGLRFYRVMAYRPAEAHVLVAAWDQYPRTASLPVPVR